jgi:hypothetical protein
MSGRHQVSRRLIQTYIGSVIEDPNEQRFLARLRTDLERLGVRTRIHANFITRRQQRQVDFLILTERRLVHAELKTADLTLPIIADLNSPWAQQLPNGTLRRHDRNYYRQALETTYAISDDMRTLAARGEVPQSDGPFYTAIHTVLCISPDIPTGSVITTHKHVDVVGYEQLLALCAADGPRPDWSYEHWDAFSRYLQLVPDESGSPEERARRATIATLEDYRRRFTATHNRELPAYVPVPAVVDAGSVPDPAIVLATAATNQRTAVVTGPSGAGKSFAARRAALSAAETGAVPIWVRCGEYQRGRLSHALSRAVAPFTTESCLPLLRQALGTGSPVVVILDGLNECRPDDRAELLEQLDALRLRMPVGVIITSTVPVNLTVPGVTLTTVLPDADTRTALLTAYGHAGELPGGEAFQTPMELAMAATCGEQLRSNATSTELLDAYIGRRCPFETTRAGLRVLAVEMNWQMRGSLTTSEVRALLHRGSRDSLDAGLDAVLNSPLLALTQGRVAFTHELFARFLAAEQLVLKAHDTSTLAESLREPRQAHLKAHAVVLEPDADRRRDLLLALADTDLLRAAVHGMFDLDTKAAIRTEVDAVLTQATLTTAHAQFIRPVGDPDLVLGGDWQVSKPRTDTEQALLLVAGRCLADGIFLEQTCAVYDATDRRCADEMRALRDGGHRAAISTIVRSTYGGLYYSDERERGKLPASVITNACNLGRLDRHPTFERSAARRILDGTGPTPPRWGRLIAALELLNQDDPSDLALLPDLFTAAWKANGYNLRLTALMTADQLALSVDDVTRERMRAALEACDTTNIFLNSALFETQARYGGIEPLNTEASINEDIVNILAEYDNPDADEAWAAALRIIGMVFEDQNLHGPFYEVLASLDPVQCLRLHVMAARSEEFPFNRDWLMNAIVERIEHVDDAARDVLRDGVLSMDWRSSFREETVGAHLIALRGWAQIADHLPPAPSTDMNTPRWAWRIVDELLFALLRGANPAEHELTALWTGLIDLWAPAAVDVLTHVRAARMWEHSSDSPGLYERLLKAWPAEMRRLAEWATRNQGQITATFDNGPAHDWRRHLVDDLAIIGTAETARLLHDYVHDPEIGPAAVATIRAIKSRAA